MKIGLKKREGKVMTKEYINNDEALDKISDELSTMSVNDFSDLVDKYDLGINFLDEIFCELREVLFIERKNNE